jgi:uncharacterized protein YjbI with pentapeptide repeats
MRAMKASMVIKPAAPKLLRELPLWSGAVEDRLLELEDCKLESGNFKDITRLQIEGSSLRGIDFSGLQLEKCELTDALFTKVDCIGLRASEASWLRVEMADSRMTGVDFGGAHFEDCVFRNLKLDEAGFRFATFKRVRFEGCILRKADVSNAKMQQVVFKGCDFEAINFDSASCTSVDIRDQNLTTIKGVYGLKNTRITSEQLVQLAPLLAAELKFHIDDGA